MMCALACAAMTANACDTGDYNDLKCDPAQYKSECIAHSYYMMCNPSAESPEKGELITVKCESPLFCFQNDSGARCVDKVPTDEQCNADACASDNALNKCINGAYERQNCPDETPICTTQNGVAQCVAASQPQTCEMNTCKGNTLVKCENGVVTDEVVCENATLCQETKDENGVVNGAECAESHEECTADACDGAILKKCEIPDGSTTGTVSSTQNCAENPDNPMVCGTIKDEDGNSILGCTNTCTQNTCADNNRSYLECVDGVVTQNVVCSETQVCANGDCIDKCTQDRCTEDGKIEICDTETGLYQAAVDCADANACFTITTGEGESEVTRGVCKEACTANTTACADSKTLRTCNAQGYYDDDKTCGVACVTKVVSGTSETKVTVSECIELPSDEDAESAKQKLFVGTPCECTGDNCQLSISGTQIKALLSDSGKTWYEELGSDYAIADTDDITGQYYFGTSTCDALAAKLGITVPDGMVVGCFRNSDVKFPAAFTKLFGLAWGDKIGSTLSDAGKSDAVIQYIKDKLGAVKTMLDDGIQISAPQGYCTLGALRIDGSLKTDSTAIDIFNEKAFSADETQSFVSAFNGGDYTAIAADASCPEGSSLYKYNISKHFSSLGNATIQYAFCLKNCTLETANDDCRDGYQCMQLTENSYQGDKTARPFVCFPQANHEYMENTIKKTVNDFMMSLIKEDSDISEE